jgi:hypothetical protein
MHMINEVVGCMHEWDEVVGQNACISNLTRYISSKTLLH